MIMKKRLPGGDAYIATTRFIPLHAGKGRKSGKAIAAIIDYVENPKKTDNGKLISSYECDSRLADAEFALSQRIYQTKSGREQKENDVIAYQIRQSFKPGEITPEEANRLGYELGMRFTKGKHAFIVCTHIDRRHIHNHIIFNSVSLDCTKKFRDFLGSGKAIRRLSDTICIENGYSVIEEPKRRRGLSYNRWQEQQGIENKLSHRDVLRQAINKALSQKPADFETLLELLQADNIEIDKRGKNWRLKAVGWKQFARLDSLGEGYSEAELKIALTSAKAPEPKEKINLLVDIQAKLAEGKGGGYSRWASVFNLKQMAKTYNYLNENDLLSYEELALKTAAASERFNELSERIKTAEKRMAEIAVLKTHIINYAKTRETYVAYRKAGYSKKFAAEHESALLLHKAAKQFFDEAGLKKLPTVKSLQAEYSQLLTDKKAAYGEYRQVREEMKELLTVKANVDSLLEVDANKEKTTQREPEVNR